MKDVEDIAPTDSTLAEFAATTNAPPTREIAPLPRTSNTCRHNMNTTNSRPQTLTAGPKEGPVLAWLPDMPRSCMIGACSWGGAKGRGEHADIQRDGNTHGNTRKPRSLPSVGEQSRTWPCAELIPLLLSQPCQTATNRVAFNAATLQSHCVRLVSVFTRNSDPNGRAVPSAEMSRI